MVAVPAVDANPAQHHLPSFASQFVSIGFVGQGCRGTHDFGGRTDGFGDDLESPPSKQIFEEGFRGLVLAR
jgi:hypothetical protein